MRLDFIPHCSIHHPIHNIRLTPRLVTLLHSFRKKPFTAFHDAHTTNPTGVASLGKKLLLNLYIHSVGKHEIPPCNISPARVDCVIRADQIYLERPPACSLRGKPLRIVSIDDSRHLICWTFSSVFFSSSFPRKKQLVQSVVRCEMMNHQITTQAHQAAAL